MNQIPKTRLALGEFATSKLTSADFFRQGAGTNCTCGTKSACSIDGVDEADDD